MRKTQPILKSIPSVAKQSLQRICCVCRQLQPVANMRRVVRAHGEFFVQGQQHLDGRGAYVCPKCSTGRQVMKALCRSFKTTVPADLLQKLTTPVDDVTLQ